MKKKSSVEVTNISRNGFRLLVGEREMFVSFKHFPWIREASIRRVLSVELPNPGHLYWPELDVDLAVESIEHPRRFPLVSKARPNNEPHVAVGENPGHRVVRTRARHG